MTKQDFVKDSQGYGSHRKLLYESLIATDHFNLPVLELGCGDSSTPFLRQYCEIEGLDFYSYDSNPEWASKHDAVYVMDWDKCDFWDKYFSVCLLDLAPGEYRKVALMKLTNTQIIVIHDSESPGWNASDYRVRPLFSKFKYMIDDIPKEKGAPWTTCLSNTIDVTKFQL